MLAEAKKAKLVVTPVSGPEVKRLVDEILNMPPERQGEPVLSVRK